MLKWDHWHIEPSSICTLRCPRCPRAEVPESLLNKSLSLKFFQQQIGADVVAQIRKITFCGNDGDPIYCREFLEICKWIKSVNPGIHLVLITNGSYKTAAWWQKLGEIFNHHDEMHWSLDGWDQASNEQYRINSNWSSIQNGIEAFARSNNTTYRVWAAIAFRFNQDQLSHMQEQARLQNFDCFQLTKSTKFGSKYPDAYGVLDLLEPTDTKLVSASHRFERLTTPLSLKTRPGSELKETFRLRSQMIGSYSGICLIGNKGVFLNSQGEFYPCCWTANRYPHNQTWQNKFNLNHRTFNDIIADEFWQTEFLKFQSLECQTKCTPDRLNDLQHTTEW